MLTKMKRPLKDKAVNSVRGVTRKPGAEDEKSGAQLAGGSLARHARTRVASLDTTVIRSHRTYSGASRVPSAGVGRMHGVR